MSKPIDKPEPAPTTSRWMNTDGRRVAALLALDAFAGGLVVQTILSLWFHMRFGVPLTVLGALALGLPFLLCGGLKAGYDLMLYDVFRKVKPPAP